LPDWQPPAPHRNHRQRACGKPPRLLREPSLSVEKVQAQLTADEALYRISIHRIKASQLPTWSAKTTDQALIIFTRRWRQALGHVDEETGRTTGQASKAGMR
jgi:hypothetical protein